MDDERLENPDVRPDYFDKLSLCDGHVINQLTQSLIALYIFLLNIIPPLCDKPMFM